MKYEVCGGQNGTGPCFSMSILVFPISIIHSASYPSSITSALQYLQLKTILNNT